jgi:hypothetical protein
VRNLTPTFRRRLAIFFVTLYALCVVAPHAAIALTHASNIAHCLTESAGSPHDHDASKAHAHGDSAAHEHGTAAAADENSSADKAAISCCGLFFMNGLAAESGLMAFHDLPAGSLMSRAPKSLADHPPGSIHRPPIVSA